MRIGQFQGATKTKQTENHTDELTHKMEFEKAVV